MRIQIDDRNEDGRGRGRAGKRVVLVSQAHPGEEVTVRVDRTTRGTVQGRVAKVIRPDPGRVETRCSHAFHCTGCALLQVSETEEDAFKRERVRAALAGVGGFELEPTLRPTGACGYRHLAKQVFGRLGRDVFLGSYVTGTHHVTDNDGCPVLAAPLPAVLRQLAAAATAAGADVHDPARGVTGLRYAVARRSRSTGDVLLAIVTSAADPSVAAALARRVHDGHDAVVGAHVIVNTGEGNAILAGDVSPVAGADAIEDEILGHRHRIGLRTFFQVNPAAATELFRVALDAAGSGRRCLEGYAGVGALTWPLAERFEQVVAVESHPEAAQLLQEGALDRGVMVRSEDADHAIPEMLASGPWDAVVLDPPRRGLGDAVTGALASHPPERIVLLSCEPGTLGRDLPPLVAAGYGIARIVPVDQFPRTAHVETVTLLTRQRADGASG